MLKKRKCGGSAFLLGTLLSAFGIALQTRADMGISMVAAPAYILSLKISALSFGISECIVQCALFLLCCLLVKRFVFGLLWSFFSAIPYAWVLDWMIDITGSIQPETFMERMIVFLIGTVILAVGIAFYFRTNLPSQVYEMFVKVLADDKGWNINKVKIIYDWISCFMAVLMSVVFFNTLKGIGVGTIICTILNGPLIALCGKCIDTKLNFKPIIKIQN